MYVCTYGQVIIPADKAMNNIVKFYIIIHNNCRNTRWKLKPFN